MGPGLFSVVYSYRTRGDGHKLEPRKFHMSMRGKKNVYSEVSENRIRLPREAVESPWEIP